MDGRTPVVLQDPPVTVERWISRPFALPTPGMALLIPFARSKVFD
jgi:hypothetical protein